MRTHLLILAAIVAAALAAVGTATAATSSTAVTQVRSVYRTVLTAEYFGPASGVCSHLTASGIKYFTAGGTTTCEQAFAQNQHILQHKTKDDDNSGYTAAHWRTEVNQVMSHLKVTVHGTHATAIGGQSGIPGQTTLVEVSGKWYFSSYPPSVSS